jgi:hypothetical protein
MTRGVQIGAALMLGVASALLSAAVVLAVMDNGERNGQDLNCCGWFGSDNPEGKTGSYSVDNTWQDVWLSEWAEPKHDWVRDRFMRWNAAAEQKLNDESAQKGLGPEIRIHDQDYFNFTGNWNTNLPWSGAAVSENWFEEAVQGYTEIDLEIQEPVNIVKDFNYFWDIQVDAEKPPNAAKPEFYSEIEYCDNNFASNCNWDVTGKFWKKILQQ